MIYKVSDEAGKNEEFLILTHMKPDGGAVASTVGLAVVLKSIAE